MLRTILLVVVPLLAPTVLYIAWVALARRRAAAGGIDLQEVPWTWLAAAGVALAAVVAVGIVSVRDQSIGRNYVPAHMDESGRVVPGRYE